jgi:hypothetical protein
MKGYCYSYFMLIFSCAGFRCFTVIFGLAIFIFNTGHIGNKRNKRIKLCFYIFFAASCCISLCIHLCVNKVTRKIRGNFTEMKGNCKCSIKSNVICVVLLIDTCSYYMTLSE